MVSSTGGDTGEGMDRRNQRLCSWSGRTSGVRKDTEVRTGDVVVSKRETTSRKTVTVAQEEVRG